MTTEASPALLLLHSPIVGPDTWGPVTERLRDAGQDVLVPRLSDDGTPPFWSQHVDSAVTAVQRAWAAGTPVVVVAHSGAGQLVGAIGEGLRDAGLPVAAYLFVDAGLPTDGPSRLDQLAAELPDVAEEVQAVLRAGEPFPDWGEDQLRPLVPDDGRRTSLMAGLRHLPIEYWTEQMPRSAGWPDAPCGVVLLSGGYEATAEESTRRGWPVRRIGDANHFLLLADEVAVAAAIVEVAAEISTR